VPGVVAGLDVGTTIQEEPDGPGAARIGGGVQRGAPVATTAGLDGEAEIEHQLHSRSAADLSGLNDGLAFLGVGQPVEEARVVRHLPLRGGVVGAQAGRQCARWSPIPTSDRAYECVEQRLPPHVNQIGPPRYRRPHSSV
jgi:hypothetical protein